MKAGIADKQQQLEVGTVEHSPDVSYITGKKRKYLAEWGNGTPVVFPHFCSSRSLHPQILPYLFRQLIEERLADVRALWPNL
jgi:hypothetical protein